MADSKFARRPVEELFDLARVELPDGSKKSFERFGYNVGQIFRIFGIIELIRRDELWSVELVFDNPDFISNESECRTSLVILHNCGLFPNRGLRCWGASFEEALLEARYKYVAVCAGVCTECGNAPSLSRDGKPGPYLALSCGACGRVADLEP